MTDLLHDHTDFGFHPLCPACDQLAADMQRAGVPRVAVEKSDLLLAVTA